MNITEKELINIFWKRASEQITDLLWWKTITVELIKKEFSLVKKQNNWSYTIMLSLNSSKNQNVSLSWGLLDDSIYTKAEQWLNDNFSIEGLWFVSLDKYTNVINDDLLDFDEWGLSAIIKEEEDLLEDEDIKWVLWDLWLMEEFKDEDEDEIDNTVSFWLSWNELTDWGSNLVNSLVDWTLIWENFEDRINWIWIVKWKARIMFDWGEFKEINSWNSDKDLLDILIVFIERKAALYMSWTDIFEKINLIWDLNWNKYWKSLYIVWKNSWNNDDSKEKLVWYDFFQIVSLDWWMVSKERLIWWLSPNIVWITRITFN